MSLHLPAPVHETLGISLYRAEQSAYGSLNLRDEVYGHWILSLPASEGSE